MINTTNKIVRKIVMLCNENVKYFFADYPVAYPRYTEKHIRSDRIGIDNEEMHWVHRRNTHTPRIKSMLRARLPQQERISINSTAGCG